MREFPTGANRDTDTGKLDFDGFLSPLVVEEFAKYMHLHRHLPDGSTRSSDNWQKGIPIDEYMKSLWRHFFHVWKAHRGYERDDDALMAALMAVIFNASGYAHELLKKMR